MTPNRSHGSVRLYTVSPNARRKPNKFAAASIAVIAATATTSSAFISPSSSTNFVSSQLRPSQFLQLTTQSYSCSNKRNRGRLRSSPLFVSLAPDQSPSEQSVSQDGNISAISEFNNVTIYGDVDEKTINSTLVETEIRISGDEIDSNDEDISVAAEMNATTSVVLVENSVIEGAVITHSSAEASESSENHMKRVHMAEGVEELTHAISHDSIDLQKHVFPSIPISYDEHGMVQADATPSAMAKTNELALSTNGAVAVASNNDSEDYPQFIKFLFQKDSNGQTVASKIFNLTLLAVSFGYVFLSVINIDHGMTRGWTPSEIGMRIPLDTWASYENSLSEKPVATKTIINIVIYLLGDWLSQTIFQKKDFLDFDAARTLKNGFVGMCFGPAVHEYYEFSDWILPVDGMTFGVTNRAFKILMDQTIYLATKCSIYILAIGVLNGSSVEESSENVKNRIKPIMFTAWRFWPLVHCVTYGLIPARHRILWVNSVDLVWNAILASKARDDGESEEEIDSSDADTGEGAENSEGFSIANFMSKMKS